MFKTPLQYSNFLVSESLNRISRYLKKVYFMDFQKLIDSFYSLSCVISVEKKNSGGYGDIRIAAANQKFIDMVENPPFVNTPDSVIRKFAPNCPYDKYLPKTANFEDLCYDSAVNKKTVHTYIHLNICELWFNMFFTPINYEENGLCYCIYSSEQIEVNDIHSASSSSLTISNDVLKTCIKLRGTNDFRKTINEVINDTRTLCGAAVCTLMLVDSERATCSILATSHDGNGSVKPISRYDNIYDIAMSWLETLGESDCIIIRNERDMEFIKNMNYPWYKTLVESGVTSVVLFPLRHNRELLGYIWVTNLDTENVQCIKETLELTCFFISSEIASYKMLERLEHIGYTDMLTGINNRNAMNNRIAAIVSGKEVLSEPYGIVFADLNGLKRVNDEGGHYAGDLLLKKAAQILQEVLMGYDINRTGGDEFMIIVPDCNELQFSEKNKILKDRSSDPDNVCLSVGSFFNDSGHDIRYAMRNADEAMYRDKEKYYSEHPERKYR